MHRQDMPRYVDCVVLCDVIMPCFDMSCRGSAKIQVPKKGGMQRQGLANACREPQLRSGGVAL